MIIRTYTVQKMKLIDEACSSEIGQNFIVRSVLDKTERDEFLPTGFNDCWDIVKEQIERKKINYYGNC